MYGETRVIVTGDVNIASTIPTVVGLQDALDSKVDEVVGKQLSQEDYTTTEKSKLAGVQSGATVNDTDANLKNRTNHTGVQAISTITGLQAELDLKATITSLNTAISDLKNGVPVDGDTLKKLNDKILAIQTLLGSDNVNLDSLQELVDAIETLQASLDTILVNDLTTGGITKALTAQQGVVLKGLIDTINTTLLNKANDADVVKLTGAQTIAGDKTFTGKVLTKASTTVGAGFNVPIGVAPTPPTTGDVWMTASGLTAFDGVFTRILGGSGNLTAVTQANAEAGVQSTSSMWSSLRVRQAILGWWATVSSTIATLTGTETLTNKTISQTIYRETNWMLLGGAGWSLLGTFSGGEAGRLSIKYTGGAGFNAGGNSGMSSGNIELATGNNLSNQNLIGYWKPDNENTSPFSELRVVRISAYVYEIYVNTGTFSHKTFFTFSHSGTSFTPAFTATTPPAIDLPNGIYNIDRGYTEKQKGAVFLNNFVLSAYKIIPFSDNGLALSTLAPTANRQYYIPFILSGDRSITELSSTISTVGTTKFRIGIYSNTSNRPGSLIVQSGDLATTATGNITFATSQTFTGGTVYWLALLAENGTFRAVATGGVLNLLGFLSTSTTACTHYYQAITSGWTEMPASAGTLTTGVGSVPAIYIV